jgi:ketosteroid isomerase-like protein
MTSPEQTIRDMLAAYSRRDDEALRRLLAPDIVYHMPGRSRFAGEHRGPDEVMRNWITQRELMGGRPYQLELLEVTAGPEYVYAFVRGTAPTTGKTLRWTSVNVYTVRDGKITGCWLHLSDLYGFDEYWSEAAHAE